MNYIQTIMQNKFDVDFPYGISTFVMRSTLMKSPNIISVKKTHYNIHTQALVITCDQNILPTANFKNVNPDISLVIICVTI